MRAAFRPCIDLHDGLVKQIVGGTLSDSGPGPATNFVSDRSPEYFARLYRENELPGGHVIKLGSGNDDAARRALAAWPGGLQLGGGVNAANAADWLDAGADKVIVTSCVFVDGRLSFDRLRELTARVGSSRLVLDLSCRKSQGRYLVTAERWQKLTDFALESENLDALSECVSELLVHAVDVEGCRRGPDLELVEMLARRAPLPCVYAGGISSLDDIRAIESAGAGKISYTIGSALDIFGGSLPFAEVVSHSRTEE